MKYLSLITASVFIASLSAPAMACDRHGGGFGGFGSYKQMSNAPWASYSEYDSKADMFGAQTSGDDLVNLNSTPVLAPKAPAKPSFSSASLRAADTAQARMAIKARLEAKSKAVDADDKSSAKADKSEG
jgi:hypothetical protein